MKIYLAGPMTGIPKWNFPAFDAMAERLREAGHIVYNPADDDRINGFNPMSLTLTPEQYRAAMARNMTCICQHAEAIALLRGWEDSKGARAEYALAKAIGIPTYDAETMEAYTVKRATKPGREV